MAKVAGSNVSWQRAEDKNNGNAGKLFKQRKAINRYSGKVCENQAGLEHVKNHKLLHRPRTAIGYEDYFGDTESSKKLKAVKIKESLQDAKRSVLLNDRTRQRNCASEKMANRKECATWHMSGCENVDFDEKIRAFRALVSPKSCRISKRDLSNERLNKAKIISDGIEEIGSHLKFRATSAGHEDTELTAPSRFLNEFQLTHELDKERARVGLEYDPHKKIHASTVTENNKFNFTCQEDMPSNGTGPRSASEVQLNEFQLTYEQDKLRCRNIQDLNSTTTLEDHAKCILGHYKADKKEADSTDIGHATPVSVKNNMKQIIKQPPYHLNKSDHVCSHIVHTPASSVCDCQVTCNPASSVCDCQVTCNPASSVCDCQVTCNPASSVCDCQVTCDKTGRHEHSEEKPVLGAQANRSSEGSRERHRNVTNQVDSRTLTPSAAPCYASTAAEHTPDQNRGYPLTSHSDIPASNRYLIESSPVLEMELVSHVLQPRASLKTHLNVLGSSLLSLSSKVHKNSVSDIPCLTVKSDAVISSTKERTLENESQGNLVINSSSEISHRSSSDDASSVQVSLSFGYKFESLPSADDTSDLKQEHIQSNGHGMVNISESLSVEPIQPPQMSTSDCFRQTNVKISDGHGSDRPPESPSTSLKNGLRKSIFRAESPKQTNVSFENRSHGSPLKENRKEKTRGMIQHLSKLKCTPKYSRTDRELTTSHDAGDELYRRTSTAEMDFSLSDKESDDLSSSLEAGEIQTKDKISWMDIKSNYFIEHQGRPQEDGSNTGRGISQKILRRAMQSQPAGLRSTEKLLSEVSATQRTDTCHNVDRRKQSTKQDADIQSKRILVKRPTGKAAEKTVNRTLGENKMFEKERSKSAVEVISGKHTTWDNLSQTRPHIRQRPQSSLASKHLSNTNHKFVQSQQVHFKGGKNPEAEMSNERNTTLLMTKVAKLHQEVDQRLKSRENLAHVASGYRQGNNSMGSQHLINAKDLNDIIKIKNDNDDLDDELVKMVSERASSFTTSTPVKKSNMERGYDETCDLTLPSERKHTSVRVNTEDVLNMTGHNDTGNSEDQNLRNGQKSNSLITKQKKIISTNHSQRLESANPQPFIQDDNNWLHPDHQHHYHSATKTSTHQQSENNKKYLVKDTGSNSTLNTMLTDLHSGPNMPVSERLQPYESKNGFSHYCKWMKNTEMSIPGRASSAESLLVHLNDPSMVKLIQKLYRADPITRQIIMVKVQFFKAWQIYTISSREYRAKKKLLLQKSVEHCVHRLLFSHFTTWQLRAMHSYNMRRAIVMYHHHILRKGFRALRWSISQSKHQSQKLQVIINTLVTKARFQKWKTKAEAQRSERMSKAFTQWRQYVIEAQKICHMKEVVNGNLMQDALHWWKKCYIKKSKMNMAFSFFRKSLLRKVVACWQNYYLQCKEKKSKYSLAVSQHQRALLRYSFMTMFASFSTIRKAKSHYRHHLLCDLFWAWRKGIQICLVEKQAELVASREHWEKQTTRQFFLHWRERQKMRSAAKKADFFICRRTFLKWRRALEADIAHTQMVKSILMRKKLHRALLMWRYSVTQTHKRHKMAVALIENCYLRHIWRIWRIYITTKSTLKKKTQLHQFVSKHKTLMSCFCQWQELYRLRQNYKLTKELRSQSCARRVASQWRLICYRRSLVRLFEVTQPGREQRIMKAMFARWKSSLLRRNTGKDLADNLYSNIQQRHLVCAFQVWRREAQRAISIKPLVQRLDRQLLAKCFEAWQYFIEQKSKCKHIQATSKMGIFRKFFKSWRRQYQACQTEKQIKNQISQGTLLCVMEEWHFLIHRRKKGEHFNTSRLLQKSFYYWRNQATAQCTRRTWMKQEEKNNLDLRREYFTVWLENVQVQVKLTEQRVGQFVQRKNEKTLTQAFVSWRRHMQSTLIARAYQKTQCHRLLMTLFSAWHDLTNCLVTDAIQRFSEKIGLVSELNSSGDIIQSDALLVKNFSFSCPKESPTQRECSPSQMQEADRLVFLNDGLQAYLDDHQAKCQRLQKMAATVVHRLHHWPACVAFEQWKEYIAKLRQQKAAYKQIKTRHNVAEMFVIFNNWKSRFLSSRLAEKHRNHHLLTVSFKHLCVNKDHRRYIKHLSHLASQHHLVVVLHRFFPLWLQKTQKQRREKHIVHLWTSCTQKETELNSQEIYLTQKLGHRTLLAYFSLWLLKYQAVAKIRKVYHKHLLSWIFSTWQSWAKERHEQVVKAQNMLCKRRTQMTFKLWLRRVHQIKEVERRYQEAWRGYLRLILQQWKMWTKLNYKFCVTLRWFAVQQSQHLTAAYFLRWKYLTMKVKEIRGNQTQKLISKMFIGWRQTVKQLRNEKHRISNFQILSYTFLMKRAFHTWHLAYTQHMALQQERRHYAEQCARSTGTLWRKKTRSKKGHQLEVTLHRRRMASYFQKWKSSVQRIQCFYDTMELWIHQKNACLVRLCMKTWRTQLKANQARKMYHCRVLHTVITEWHIFAKGNKERHIQGLVFKKALEQRRLRAALQYWVAVTRLKQSVQQNVETKLQIRVLHFWYRYTCRMHNLRELQAHFMQRVSTRIVRNAFMNLRWRADYCAGLQEMADKIVRDKKRVTVRSMINMWKKRLNNILSTRLHDHILAKRGVRQWQRFVYKRKSEQLKEQENWEKAVHHHHHVICKKVFSGLRIEVMVSELIQRRKEHLCFKYARLWKLRVDMVITSASLECAFAERRMWKKWRAEFVKKKSMKHVTELLEIKFLREVFIAWRSLSWLSRAVAKSKYSLPDEKNPSPPPSGVSPSLLPVSVARSRLSPTSSSTASAANTSFGFRSEQRL